MLLKDFLSFFGLTYYPNNGYVTIGSPYNNDFAAADIMIYTSSEDVARYARMHLLDFIEDEIECSGQDGLYLQYPVTRIAQVVDSPYDRQTGTYVRFKTELHPTLEGSLLQPAIVLVCTGSCYLVGRNDRYVVFKERLIKSCNLLGSSAVDEH